MFYINLCYNLAYLFNTNFHEMERYDLKKILFRMVILGIVSVLYLMLFTDFPLVTTVLLTVTACILFFIHDYFKINQHLTFFKIVLNTLCLGLLIAVFSIFYFGVDISNTALIIVIYCPIYFIVLAISRDIRSQV